jgi:uncharacterized membrane protein
MAVFAITNLIAIRFALALVLLLFLPGFNLLEILYKWTTFLTGLQRFVLSIGMSIGIVILTNYGMTYLHIAINLEDLLIILDIVTIVLAVIAVLANMNWPKRESNRETDEITHEV